MSLLATLVRFDTQSQTPQCLTQSAPGQPFVWSSNFATPAQLPMATAIDMAAGYATDPSPVAAIALPILSAYSQSRGGTP
jgi:hypothetical protein